MFSERRGDGAVRSGRMGDTAAGVGSGEVVGAGSTASGSGVMVKRERRSLA